MNRTFFSDNFKFYEIHFGSSHHTNQASGAPYNYLAYLKTGHCRIVSPDGSIDINPGDVFLIPINLPYQSYWDGADDVICLSFGFFTLNTPECLGMELQVVQCDNATKERIIGIPVNQPVTSSVLSRFYDAMASVIPQIKRKPISNQEQIILTVKDFIAKNPECSVTEIAKKCAIGESYLYYLFKKVTGTTPNEFRQAVLCEKGINLLTTTNKTIEEISDILNISSGSYFRKILKKNTGLTPRETRKNSLF